MLQIMKTKAALTLAETISNNYSQLILTEAEKATLRRESNISRQRIRDSREVTAGDKVCLAYNKRIVEDEGYGATTAVVKEGTGGGAQPLDYKGIFKLSKFIFGEYIEQKVDEVNILQV
jgi:hypothetical protein